MNNREFKAYVVEEKDGKFTGEIKTRTIGDLPEGDLVVKVHYSSLNYKDALSATGAPGITKEYPHTPGIDAAGTVEHSESKLFRPGDKVIVTSYDLGMNTAGGFAEYIRVPSQWAVKLPGTISVRESMIYGTAGLTAGSLVEKVTDKVKPGNGKIIVSGATGGVGSMSIAILHHLGYTVTAVTGKKSEHEYLRNLGAQEIVTRKEMENLGDKPLLKTLYAGGIDTVGGVILENIIKSTSSFGAVACCGNAASPRLSLTVYPFILRGVSLLGVSSQNMPMEERVRIWKNLAEEWKPSGLAEMCEEISFGEVGEKIKLILEGGLKGRTLISVTDEP